MFSYLFLLLIISSTFNDNNARARLTMNNIKTKLNTPGVKEGGMTLFGLLVGVGLSELAEAISMLLNDAGIRFSKNNIGFCSCRAYV